MSFDGRALLARLGIVLVEARGDYLSASCPFHADGRNPNWSLAHRGPSRGLYKCWSCHARGDQADLVAHVLGLPGRAEAEAWLEEHAEKSPERAPPSSVRIVARPHFAKRFAYPVGVVEAPLEEWIDSAREYAESRGLEPWQVARWRVAYAVGGPLDGRIVVPVRDGAGALCAYHARTFVDDEKRYRYPPLRDNPDLDAIFGEEHWSPIGSGRRRVYVAEGAFNALAIERATGEPVAAIGGSDVRPIHAMKLATFAVVVVVTDPDEAGDVAAARLERQLGRHCEVRRARLPEGTDAAELARDVLAGHLSSGRWRTRKVEGQ